MRSQPLMRPTGPSAGPRVARRITHPVADVLFIFINGLLLDVMLTRTCSLSPPSINGVPSHRDALWFYGLTRFESEPKQCPKC